MVRFPPIVPLPIVVKELLVKSVVVVISSCFVPNSVMILVVPTTKSPLISTFPVIFTSASMSFIVAVLCCPFPISGICVVD